jgi:RNA polymerase sigma-70 factor (ECF subfamily)
VAEFEADRVSVELVRRAQQGDHAAFDALATEAFHRLYAIARRILRDEYVAQDAVQETLVRAWRDLRELRDPARFDAWLHRLLVHACADEGRRHRRRRVEVGDVAEGAPAPSDEIGRLADRDELERAFENLSIEHRAVLVLTHYLGMTAPEVAQTLGIPPGTVYSRLHYGTRQLREILVTAGATTTETSR